MGQKHSLFGAKLPVKGNDVIQNRFAAIFYGTKNKEKYVGNATSRFLDDENRPINGCMLGCLRSQIWAGTDLESYPNAGHLGYWLFSYWKYYITSLLELIPLKNGNWDVEDYISITEFFNEVSKLDRESFKLVLSYIFQLNIVILPFHLVLSRISEKNALETKSVFNNY